MGILKYTFQDAGAPNIALLNGMPNVRTEGREVIFSGYSKKDADKILSMASRKTGMVFETRSKAFEPTEADTAIVNGIIEEGLDLSELWFREFKAAHNQEDRTMERISPQFLSLLGQSYSANKPDLIFHHDLGRAKAVGRVFAHSIEVDSEGTTWLKLKAYGLKAIKYDENVSMEKAIQSRMVKDVSVHWAKGGSPKRVDAPGGGSIWEWHQPDDQRDFPDALELSFVNIGAQQGAQVEKSFQYQQQKSKMEINKTKSATIAGKEYEFRIKGDQDSLSLEVPDELTTEIKRLKSENESAKSIKEENEALRKKYEDDVIRFEKGLKLPEAEQTPEEDLKEMKVEKLISYSGRLEKQYIKANPVGQGDAPAGDGGGGAEGEPADQFGQW